MNNFRNIILQGIFNLIFAVIIIGVFLFVHYVTRYIFGIMHVDLQVYSRNIMFGIIIFFFRPIWRSFSRFVDRILYPLEAKLLNEVAELHDQILNEFNYPDILDRFVQGIQQIFQIKKLLIYYEKEKDPFAIYRNFGIDENQLDLLKPDFSDPLILQLSGESPSIVLTSRKVKQLHSLFGQTLYDLGLRFILPIAGRKELEGVIGIGPIYRDGINYRKTIQYIGDTVSSLAQALEHAHLYQQAKRESVEKGILMEIGSKIANYKDLKEILNWIMDAVGEILPYDAGGIFSLDEATNTMSFEAVRGYPLEIVDSMNLKISEGVVGWAVKMGKADIVPDVSKDSRYFKIRPETRSEIVVPLIIGQKVIGGFCLESDRLNAFNIDHYELLKTFVSHAALVIENAKLYFALRQKQALDRDLEVARGIQRALFPRRIPRVRGYSLTARCISREAIGGDLYDLIPFHDGRLGIAIGDSSGKGIPGAILMATLFATFRGRLRPESEVHELIRKLNNSLMQFSEPGKYSTFFYGVLNPKTGNFQYTNAGHNPPVLIRSNGEKISLDTGGAVLGFFKNLDYKKGEIVIEEGDLLTFYTDGVTETQNPQEEEFGELRLIDFLINHRSQELRNIEQKLLQALQIFAKGKPFGDDVTLIFLRREVKHPEKIEQVHRAQIEEPEEVLL